MKQVLIIECKDNSLQIRVLKLINFPCKVKNTKEEYYLIEKSNELIYS